MGQESFKGETCRMDAAIPQQTADLHVTPGRLRVRSTVLKRNASRARRVEAELAGLPNVTLARVNVTTGSITLQFDPSHWTAAELIALLRERGYLTEVWIERRAATREQRDMFTQCCTLIGKELLATAISQIFPHPLVTTLLAVV
jgi:hypothetical protein